MKRINKKQQKLVWCVVGAIVLILIIILAFNVFSKKTHIILQGECGLVMGKLHNKIETESICSSQCLNVCISLDKERSKSVFLDGGDTGCNSCDCYCKG